MTGESHGLAALALRAWESGAEQAADQYWSLTRHARSGNGVVFRATGDGEPYAVKLSPVDARLRGIREHTALVALARTGLAVAPRPHGLVVPDAGPSVLLTSWLDAVPAGEPDPAACVALVAALHRHTLDRPAAVLPAFLGTPARLVAELRRVAARAARRDVDAVVAEVCARTDAPDGEPVRPALLHHDANLDNVVSTAGGPRLVDWENAGWGDPCYDVADICTHPGAYADRPDLWPGLVERHAADLGDPALARRSWAFIRLLTALWAAVCHAEASRPKPRLAGTRRFSPQVQREQAGQYVERFWRLSGAARRAT